MTKRCGTLYLCTGIPDALQSWRDPALQTLTQPDTNLAENYYELSAYEQAKSQETIRKRIMHHYYSALTAQYHFDAMSGENSIRQAQAFTRAAYPAKGNLCLSKMLR